MEVVDTIAAERHIPTDVAERVKSLLADVGASVVSDEQVLMLAYAVNREEELRNASTTGYLRGRNERIEALQHFEQTPPSPKPAVADDTDIDVDDSSPRRFPVYNRRSIWN